MYIIKKKNKSTIPLPLSEKAKQYKKAERILDYEVACDEDSKKRREGYKKMLCRQKEEKMRECMEKSKLR